MNLELHALLRARSRHAQFLKVNLHVHTPATPWCWNQYAPEGSPKAGAMRVEDLATAIVAAELDVVAITDHDTVAWVDRVREAVRVESKRRSRDVTILPGVEITTYDGVHLLALYDPAQSTRDIHEMLIRFGLRADGVGSERCSSEWPLEKVAAEVVRTGGLVVAPHAANPRLGIWGGPKSHHTGKRIQWLKRDEIRILACRPDQIDSIAAGIRGAGISRTFTFITHSDSHSLDQLRANSTYVKVAERSLEGLRQVVHEPKLRVRSSEPSPPSYARILAVQLNGGYFSDQSLALSPNLNTLIGGNYAGKSAIIDAIRFAFDDPCYRDEVARQSLLDRVAGILPDGTVRCWFTDSKGSTYRVDRAVVISEKGYAGSRRLEAQVRPVVARLDGAVEIPVSSTPLEITPIDFYGQGSVGQISRQTSTHRDLIDSMAGCSLGVAELDALKETKEGNVANLFALATEVANLETDRVRLQSELERLHDLEAQLATLNSQAKGTVLAKWAEWEHGRRVARSAARNLTGLTERITGAVAALSIDEIGIHSDNADVAARIAAIADATDELELILATLRDAIPGAVAPGIAKLQDAMAKWEEAYSAADARRKEALAEVGLGSLSALQKKVQELEEEIEHITRVHVPAYEGLAQRKAVLDSSVTQVHNEIREQWAVVRRMRRERIAALNGSLPANVRIQHREAADSGPYASYLAAIISRASSRESFVQRRDREIRLICDAIPPAALAAMLLEGDADSITSRTGVTPNTASVMIGMSVDAKVGLYAVEPEDEVVIQYRRAGEDELTDLSKLSPGERSLALLTVAFANSGSPIVIDQPEDELGQMLVTQELVETIRNTKEARQYIVVTHNANIPVLGDAEGVFCLMNVHDASRNSRRCYVGHEGSIETPRVASMLLSLEGGPESFRRRQEKYGVERRQAES